MWMKNSESVDIKDTTIPQYPLMMAADEIARRAVENEIIKRIVFYPSLDDKPAVGRYTETLQVIRIGVRDCAKELPFVLSHEVAHGIDDHVDHSISQNLNPPNMDSREVVAETYERACLDPRWVDDHAEDVALLCHDMQENDVSDSLVPTWHL
jgi:hypothetical protein